MTEASTPKKVALIWPGDRPESLGFWPPINLGYLAAYLERHGIEVRIIDQPSGEDVAAVLRDFQPDLVGVTALTVNAPAAYAALALCRNMGLRTVMGGLHASAVPEEALQHADIVVCGEGEAALLDIVQNDIKSGIITRPYIKDIDDIPQPAWHLMNLKPFFKHQKSDEFQNTCTDFLRGKGRLGLVITSRGCPYRCIFCYNSNSQVPFRAHSAERVMAEVRYHVETYGVKGVYFLDDDFFVNKQRLAKVCAMLKESRLGITWACATRVNHVDEKTLAMVKDAGCIQMVFGFESGSQRILDVLGKKATVEQARRAIELCHQAGLPVYGSFMIGNPTETREDIAATLRFMHETGLYDYGFGILTPYPGTKLWDWCRERGLIKPDLKWEDLRTFRAAIPVCAEVPAAELERLVVEGNEERMDRVGTSAWRFLRRRLLHPADTLRKIFSEPGKIFRVLRRLRLR